MSIRGRLVTVALALLAWSPPSASAQTNWTRSTEIWFNPDNPKSPVPVFVNTASGVGLKQFPRGRWVSVDLASCCNVPPDAKQAFLAGVLIVTAGSGQALCDLRVAFRAPGSRWNAANYLGQSIAFSGG